MLMKSGLYSLLYIFPLLAYGGATQSNYEKHQYIQMAEDGALQQREFSAWRNLLREDIINYREALQDDFDIYRRTLNKEYTAYRSSINQVWDKVEVSGPKVWVEYSDDRLTKRIVDYEKNEIRIHVIEKKERDAKKVLEDSLKDMLGESIATALRREPVMSKVEQSLHDSSITVRAAEPGGELVLQELFKTPTPGAKEIMEKANALLDKGNIGEEMAKSGKGAQTDKVHAMVIRIPLPKGRALRKAEEYRAVVQKHGRRWRINESLILAIIHTESAFNPMATSYVPAYGMMQIVPKYAGLEVSEKLWGEPVLLAPSYLYNADNNIMVGTVYLNMLFHEYFQNVRDDESRILCVISAYNTGPGNVARAFTGGRNIGNSVTVINTLTATEVYARLSTDLPYKESRNYVQRVAKRMKAYQAM